MPASGQEVCEVQSKEAAAYYCDACHQGILANSVTEVEKLKNGSYLAALNQHEVSLQCAKKIQYANHNTFNCVGIFPKDVTIGHGAVIGAGSVITHDVPPYAIVAGTGGGANSKGIINGYRLFDESISDLLEFNWRNYDLPNMLAQGIKVPLKNVKDFIDFMKNEGREYLIPLPERWFYLNILNAHSVQLFCVDFEQPYMGSLIEPVCIAVLEDVEFARRQAQQVVAQQAAQQKVRAKA